jgi:transcription antitermination factor NusB
MSFDKAGKNTGTRRKARECALQMLFAVDVVGRGEFSSERYWSELGFDEIQRGAATQALEFRDELAKFASVPDTIKSWLKKTDPLERTNKRSDWVRPLVAGSEALRRSFVGFVTELVDGRDVTMEGVTEKARALAEEFDRATAALEAKIVNGPVRLTSEDRTHFADFRSQGRAALAKLHEELTPSFSKLAAATAATRPFANKLLNGTIENLSMIDDRIRTRAEHWRIERMAIVDRNVLRLAVYEFLYEDTPHTVVINEALEIARRFSTFEATQFINGILDAIKLDLEKGTNSEVSKKRSHSSAS